MRRLNSSLEHIVQTYQAPEQRLREAVANHIRLHTSYKAEFFIIDTEIRALEGENRAYILGLRDTYDAMLQQIVREGIEQGVFRQSDVKVASYAIIAMCTEVATWFRPGGRLTVQQVIDLYHQMITRGLLQQSERAAVPVESVQLHREG